MAQVIQEFVTQSSTLVRTRHKTSHIEKLNRHRASSLEAASVVRLALIRDVIPLTGAFYLKVTNGALGIDGSEADVIEGMLGRS